MVVLGHYRCGDNGDYPQGLRHSQTGMSYKEAVMIIGCEGTISSQSKMNGIETIMYTWKGSGDLGANANAMFQNNNLVSKAQAGLK